MPRQFSDLKTILAEVRAGSEDAALELVETYGPAVRIVVRRYVREHLRRRYDSEDFTQAMWASFFKRLPSLEAVDCPKMLIGILMRMAKNKIVDALRREERGARHHGNEVHSLDGSAKWAVSDLTAPDPSPSACAAANEKWDQLSPRDRRILELLCQGMHREQIAAELTISERTVRRVFRQFLWGADS